MNKYKSNIQYFCLLQCLIWQKMIESRFSLDNLYALFNILLYIQNTYVVEITNIFFVVKIMHLMNLLIIHWNTVHVLCSIETPFMVVTFKTKNFVLVTILVSSTSFTIAALNKVVHALTSKKKLKLSKRLRWLNDQGYNCAR